MNEKEVIEEYTIDHFIEALKHIIKVSIGN